MSFDQHLNAEPFALWTKQVISRPPEVSKTQIFQLNLLQVVQTYLLILFLLIWFIVQLANISSCTKLANITLVHKKDSKTSKCHYRPVSIFRKYMRHLCLSKYLNILNHSFWNVRGILGEVLVPNVVFCQCLKKGNW